jgi:Zn-dependent peptidase ImmA (M78 family)
MIGRHQIEKIANHFWAAAGGRERYGQPVDINAATSTALRIPIIKISGLTFEKANGLLTRIGGPQDASGGPTALHGLIVADQDTAIIFINGDDTVDEQRATAAHEVSHFLRHYREPREQVRRLLGPSIEDVLMRRRSPKPTERLAAVMRGVPLACFRCSEPYDRATLLGSTQEIEDEADAVALEILAPRSDVRRRHLRDAVSIARIYGIPLRMAQIAEASWDRAHTSPTVLDIFRSHSRR